MGAGCPTRKEIEAYAWLNNGLPIELCEKHPELRDYGFYRKLNGGKIEFLSFCHAEARKFIGFHERDMKRLLDKYLPDGRKGD